jgi:hypothetical protein
LDLTVHCKTSFYLLYKVASSNQVKRRDNFFGKGRIFIIAMFIKLITTDSIVFDSWAFNSPANVKTLTYFQNAINHQNKM